MPTMDFTIESFCDDLGPAKVIHLYEPHAGLHGMVVVDNTACGPAIGGVRMAVDVTAAEVFRLARAMTLKNAAAGLPHGGGKAGIVADPGTPDKQRLVRAFARAIRDLVEYIPGPDMGTDETCMAWIHDEIGRSVGRPRVLGGIPLDEIGATGFGLAHCAEIASLYVDFKIQGATFVVEGFGNVGRHVAHFLEKKGARLIGASDSRGGVHDPDGIAVEELEAVKRQAGTVTGYKGGRKAFAGRDLLTVPCDILIPAARPDCIHAGNVKDIKARLVLEGANIPASSEMEAILHERRILVVPDIIANAGGVICASVEYCGGTETMAYETIAQKVRSNTQAVLSRSRERGIMPRRAAVELARNRVKEAMAYRQGLTPDARGPLGPRNGRNHAH